MSNASVTANPIATATATESPKFYSDSELSSKTQKQLISIALEFGEVIEPSTAKKMKNAGLIAAIVDLQDLQSAHTASLPSIEESIAVIQGEPVQAATVKPDQDDSDRITDADIEALNMQLSKLGSVLSFKRYKSGIKLFSSKLNSSIKGFDSLEAAWSFVESQPDNTIAVATEQAEPVQAATTTPIATVATVTTVKRGDVTVHINPVLEGDDLGSKMSAGLSAIAAKHEGKKTAKNNSSGKGDKTFTPNDRMIRVGKLDRYPDGIKPVRSNTDTYQYFCDLLKGCTLQELIDRHPNIAKYTDKGVPNPMWKAGDVARDLTGCYGYTVFRSNGVYKIVGVESIKITEPKIKEVKVKEPKTPKVKVSKVEPTPIAVAAVPSTAKNTVNIARSRSRNRRAK